MNADYSIFISLSNLNGPIISIFVDDIKIIAPKRSGFIKKVKAKLVITFSIFDMGLISFYLGFKVDCSQENKTLKFSQLAYIKKVLQNFFLSQANLINTSIKNLYSLFQRIMAKKLFTITARNTKGYLAY